MNIPSRYEQIGPPLTGGMASVIRCKDVILDREVAIKVMPGGAEQRRMRDELKALLKMRSKHVVQVYDVLKIGPDDLAIVQEFIAGNDLFHASHGQQNLIDYLKIVWQVSSGIADIHALSVIHRDIKPNNMKVDSEGVVKIFDFGLSREEGDGAATVGFVGTPGFAAPELYAHNAKFTAAVDTYAFGATALFLALRDLPATLKRRPPVASAGNYFTNLSFGLSDEVANALNSCLEANPKHRPLMHEVRDTLAKHLLHNRHKALVVFQGKASYLDAQRRSVSLRLLSMGEVEIRYDGFSFSVGSVSGYVSINNRMVTVGDVLPGACVVTLGAPEHGNQRKYITFDVSHPEIVL